MSKKKFQIVIPTRDSATWIGPFLTAYRTRFGLEPLYVVDPRSSDGTADILRSMSANVTFCRPAADFPEAGMIEFAASKSLTPWILRFDDDEFPSHALIQWVQNTGVDSLNRAWYISRRELFRGENGAIVFSRRLGRYSIPSRPDFLGGQARLHHVDRVQYLQEVHTSGFKDLTYTGFAPSDAFFVHCSALMRSPEARIQKIRAYETLKPFSCWIVADEYLPEVFAFENHNSSTEGLDEFSSIINELRRPSAEDFSITEVERQLATEQVARFSELTHAARVAYSDAIAAPQHSTNNLEWLRVVPAPMRIAITEALLSFATGALRKRGLDAWNYLYEMQQCAGTRRHSGSTSRSFVLATRTLLRRVVAKLPDTIPGAAAKPNPRMKKSGGPKRLSHGSPRARRNGATGCTNQA